MKDELGTFAQPGVMAKRRGKGELLDGIQSDVRINLVVEMDYLVQNPSIVMVHSDDAGVPHPGIRRDVPAASPTLGQ